ncbi:MAG: hypothetical protein C5B46_01905 [Proteobacteria bacterium]|nr:MAG: hypothetical protein C5B46_01905 [Pseudomonadota bacterium]
MLVANDDEQGKKRTVLTASAILCDGAIVDKVVSITRPRPAPRRQPAAAGSKPGRFLPRF